MPLKLPAAPRTRLALLVLLATLPWAGTAWGSWLSDDPVIATANVLGEADDGLSKALRHAGGGAVRWSAEITTLPVAEDPGHSTVSAFSALVHRGGSADFELVAWKLGIGGLTRSATAYSGGFLGFAIGAAHVNQTTHAEDPPAPGAVNTAIGDQIVPAAGVYLEGYEGKKTLGAHFFFGWTYLSQIKTVTSHPGSVTQKTDHVDWGILSVGLGLSFVL